MWRISADIFAWESPALLCPLTPLMSVMLHFSGVHSAIYDLYCKEYNRSARTSDVSFSGGYGLSCGELITGHTWPSVAAFWTSWPSKVTCLIFRSCTALEALWLTGVDWPKARAQIGAAIRGELFLSFHLRIQLQELVVFVFSCCVDGCGMHKARAADCQIDFLLLVCVCVRLCACCWQLCLSLQSFKAQQRLGAAKSLRRLSLEGSQPWPDEEAGVQSKTMFILTASCVSWMFAYCSHLRRPCIALHSSIMLGAKEINVICAAGLTVEVRLLADRTRWGLHDYMAHGRSCCAIVTLICSKVGHPARQHVVGHPDSRWGP